MSSSNQRTRSSGGRGVDAEVQKLFRKSNGKISSADFLALRKNYGDVNSVDAIQKAFMEKYSYVVKKAKKFARLVREKYSDGSYPYHILLQKAHKYKKKYSMSDDEFAAFQRIYEQELSGTSPVNESLVPLTNMGKVLGDIRLDSAGTGIEARGDEYKYLQEIMKLYASTRSLHAQVVLQAMQYKGNDYEALTGQYKKEHGHNPACHIHPVIAAMFLPKMKAIEHHFLYANIAGIVKSRYEKTALRTKPDYLLFYSLVTDPNDVVCDKASPMKDLLARCHLQQNLWNSVLKIRNGQYYDCDTAEFLSSIDMCKLNKHDNPDLIYGRFDGTVVKRLLSAFSYRPTVIASLPYTTRIYANNPYSQNIKPTVTSIPMINLRLAGTLGRTGTIRLSDALSQSQWTYSRGPNNSRVLGANTTELIYSRGSLIFYVDRRAHFVRVGNMEPFNMSRLPVSVAGFERLNPRPVTVGLRQTIRGDEYKLISAVVSEVNNNTDEPNTSNLAQVVVGSSAAIMIHPEAGSGVVTPIFYHYDPLSVARNAARQGSPNHIKPVSQLVYAPNPARPGSSFQEMVTTRGIVFFYNRDDTSNNSFTY